LRSLCALAGAWGCAIGASIGPLARMRVFARCEALLECAVPNARTVL
jgi:hypothetical protein